MNNQQYKRIKNHNFEVPNSDKLIALDMVATWGIWEESDQYQTKIIEENISKLKPSKVFVGLNFSGSYLPEFHTETWKPWQNFHGGNGGPKRLFEALMNSELEGAYITDILKLIPESDSSKLMRRIRKNELDITAQYSIFANELLVLNENKIDLYFMGGLSGIYGKTIF